MAGRKSGENSDGYEYDARRLSRQGEQQYGGKGGGDGAGVDGRAWRAGGSVRSGNGTTGVTWDNAAELMPESGFDEGKWLSANYVAKITGLLYNDLTGAQPGRSWCWLRLSSTCCVIPRIVIDCALRCLAV